MELKSFTKSHETLRSWIAQKIKFSIKDFFSKWGPLINYVTLKLPFFDQPIPHHHALSRIITRSLLRYVTPDTDTLTQIRLR